MSQIFDALQRSESESSGVDISALSEATELLERAERRAASAWNEPAPPEKDEAAAKASALPGIADGLRIAFAEETPHREPAPNAALDVFTKIQPVAVSLTARSRIICATNPESAASEAFRLLAVRLRNLRRDRTLKRLLITSAMPQEGKSMVSANLACALAIAPKEKVLLIEGDIRRPSLTATFSLSGRSGLCQCLKDPARPESNISQLEGVGIWILPAGSAIGNPLEVLQSRKMSTMLDQLASWFDWIIIDSPPVLPMADTSIWARMADGILLVARQGTTEKRALQKGLEALEPKKIVGAILNSCAISESDYYYYQRAGTEAPEAGNLESN